VISQQRDFFSSLPDSQISQLQNTMTSIKASCTGHQTSHAHSSICLFENESLLSQKKMLLKTAVWGLAEQDRISYKGISLHFEEDRGTHPTINLGDLVPVINHPRS